MSAFQRYSKILQERKWSPRYWDGRPTKFLPLEEYEGLFLDALEEQDIPALTLLLDELPADVMDDVADRITDLAFPSELEWYVTTKYPLLLETLTPKRVLASPDLQDALATWPSNLYILLSWWKTSSRGKDAIAQIKQLFTEGSVVDVDPSPLPNTLEQWRRMKKALFIPKEEKGPILEPVKPQRPQRLPPRQN